MNKSRVSKRRTSNSVLLSKGKFGVKSILTIIFILIISLPVLGYLVIYTYFNGGISGTISSLKPAPDPNGTKLTTKRNVAIASIDNAFKEIEPDAGVKKYATSTHDRCYKGDHGYKRNDDYAYRCSYRITRFYGFDGDFRQKMMNFEEKLYSIGWKAPIYDPAYPMKRILEGSYDKYYSTGTQIYPQGFYVSDLANPRYEKNEQSLEIDYAESQTRSLSELDYMQEISGDSYDEIYEEKKFQNIDSVFKEIIQYNDYVLTISIQQDYFRN